MSENKIEREFERKNFECHDPLSLFKEQSRSEEKKKKSAVRKVAENLVIFIICAALSFIAALILNNLTSSQFGGSLSPIWILGLTIVLATFFFIRMKEDSEDNGNE
ncbi:MAG: hypothetical protein J5525_12485 [Lachnospiraceae bacterium]|nr:hypothetical protein [Lachnospiraceae bacterium]